MAADDSGEYIEPVAGRAPISGLDGTRETGKSPRRHRTVRGRIVAVRGEKPHQDPTHVLDVTVGATPYTEIVVRTTERGCEPLEGKTVLITVDDS